MRGLKDKVAVVTASTRGIGFAIAKRLALEGTKVVISSRNQANVDSAVKELNKVTENVLGVKCHVELPAERSVLLKETLNKFGQVDMLINSAGVNPSRTYVLNCEESAWDKTFSVNVKSAFMLTKEFLPYLRKSKESSIVYISSVGAYIPLEVLGVYSVTKAALIALAKNAAFQLGQEGIRVNCVVPGIIYTDFSKLLYVDPVMCQKLLRLVALNRFGEQDEVAGITAFLCSDDASYITGECVCASGGIVTRF